MKAVLDPERGYLNKWQMYRALYGENIGPCQLPETQVSYNPRWRDLLPKHPITYIKPVALWGGSGVSVIRRQTDEKYTWKTLEREVPDLTLEQVQRRLQPRFAAQVHIVQQGAPLTAYEGRPFDIRALWQREGQGWVYTGALARVGAKGAIVSNVGTGHGEVRPVLDVLAQVLPSKTSSFQVLDNIRETGRKMTRLLSRYRDFVEVGIDFGLSKTGQLWLIEVNTDDALGGPSHALFKALPDKTVYQQIEQRSQLRNMLWL